jgi:hypothetical protein
VCLLLKTVFLLICATYSVDDGNCDNMRNSIYLVLAQTSVSWGLDFQCHYRVGPVMLLESQISFSSDFNVSYVCSVA